MQDKDLQRLSEVTPRDVPEHRRRMAVDAALHAFEAQAESASEENQKNFQGKGWWSRLTEVMNNLLWRPLMKKQWIAGTALGGVLAVVVTTQLMDTTYYSPPRVAELSDPRLQPQNDMPEKEENIADSLAAPETGGAATRTARDAMPVASSPAMKVQRDFSMAEPQAVMSRPIAPQSPERDRFEKTDPNPLKLVAEEPVSTFSVDVDTASYSFVRRALNEGRLPQKDAVRVEELINYFDYNYPLPEDASQPFKPTVNVFTTPWNPKTKLLHIGIKGHDVIPAEKPASNLVFLLDVSGSMHSEDKLPLLKKAFRLLVDQLDAKDTVSIVTYAGHSATVLEPTSADKKQQIYAALDGLQSGGSTAGAQGIEQAYALAEQHFNQNGVNRVMLATDGDFNVGITDQEQLKDFIERKRDSGIFLSILGFGRGNYNDALMQKLAQNGNGTAAYIDTLNEARKVLVDEAASTLFPIAKDVKIQIEFNPQTVSEYRLIGYETRMLNREDFNNDKVDAGDIGSGHSVTAIYEITPKGSDAELVDPLRYGKAGDEEVKASGGEEYAFLKLRYKLPDADESKLLSLPVTKAQEKDSVAQEGDDVRFATAVAAFGQLLRGESQMKGWGYQNVIDLASGAKGADNFGYRAEFVNLVRLAKSAEAM
jgi:Ca-activated chloride channel family protein